MELGVVLKANERLFAHCKRCCHMQMGIANNFNWIMSSRRDEQMGF